MRGINKDSPDIEDEDDVKVENKIMTTLKGLRDKLKLGPHHKMERFSILVSTSLLFLLMFTGTAFFNHRSDVQALSTSQAVFTDKFKFSLSDQSGTVEGIYGNEEKTDAMILIKMNNPQEMSSDPNNYQLWVTGQKKPLKVQPDITFSLFGSTGYGVIRFKSEEPLNREIMSVTIRSYSDLSSSVGGGAGKDLDESFNEYDQARIFVNVGAENVEIIDGFKAGEDDPTKLYIGLIAKDEEALIQEEIKEITKELGKLLNREKEYSNRIINMGYIPPETPSFIKGDYVDEEGIFRPATTMNLGHKIDYWSKSIEDGYLSQVIGDLSEYAEYSKKHSLQGYDVDGDEDINEDVPYIDILQHNDGSELDTGTVITGTSSSVEVDVKDSLESLLTTWRSYTSSKVKLQKDLLNKLIVLDANVQSQKIGYKVRDAEKGVIFY